MVYPILYKRYYGKTKKTTPTTTQHKAKDVTRTKETKQLKTSYVTWLMTIRKDVLMLFLRILSDQLQKEGDIETLKAINVILQKKDGHISDRKVMIVKEVRKCVRTAQWDKAISDMKVRLSA